MDETKSPFRSNQKAKLAASGFHFHRNGGWLESRLVGWGTIVLTALRRAAIQLQYDLYGVAAIFCFRIFPRLVWLQTGSVLLDTALHCLQNLAATIQVEWLLTNA